MMWMILIEEYIYIEENIDENIEEYNPNKKNVKY